MPIDIENSETDFRSAMAKAGGDRGLSKSDSEASPRKAGRPLGAAEAEARMAQLHRELTALPILDPRSPDKILGYDDSGLSS